MCQPVSLIRDLIHLRRSAASVFSCHTRLHEETELDTTRTCPWWTGGYCVDDQQHGFGYRGHFTVDSQIGAPVFGLTVFVQATESYSCMV